MTTLGWILVMSLLGGALSIAAAGAVAWRALGAWVPTLVSYAIGTLLGAAFLEILPHAVEHGGGPRQAAMVVLLGILGFFVLEKLVLWRHCHEERCEGHEAHPPGTDHGRSGLMILVGDTFHNFVDGVLIAAAFLQDVHLGLVTSIAIIAHEIPQETGDFLILLHSGYSKAKAFGYNLLSSLATLVGAMLAYFALSELTGWIPYLLGMATASMIYVAVADLIPGLHKRTELKATVQQILLIGLGIASIVVARLVAGD